MLIKVITDIIIEVEDESAAESACATLSTGLESQLRGFPNGEIVATDVDHYEKVTDEEANEKGWVE